MCNFLLNWTNNIVERNHNTLWKINTGSTTAPLKTDKSAYPEKMTKAQFLNPATKIQYREKKLYLFAM
jgi:hypothetical protein